MPRSTRRTPAANNCERESDSSANSDREDSVLEARADGGAAGPHARTRSTLTPDDIVQPRAQPGPARDAPAEPRAPGAAARTGDGVTALDTERLLTTMMEVFARTQAESNRTVVEALRSLQPGGPWSPASRSAASPTNPSTSGGGAGGNFAKCTARFDGRERDPEVLEAFLDAVEVYKECADVTDEHALRGLPMLLSGDAAVWWRGARDDVATWPDALARLRATYGVQKPAYRVLREVFNSEHKESERAEVFICKVRSLLVKLPYAVPVAMQIDIVYGLLHRRIRKRLPRDSCVSIDNFIERARLVEDSITELSDASAVPVPSLPTVVNASASAGAALDRGVTTSPPTTIGPKLASNSNESSERVRARCGYCRSFGHDISECRKSNNKTVEDRVGNNNNNNQSIRCYGCGQQGVVRSNCGVCSKNTASVKRSDFNVVGDDFFTTTSHPLISVGIVNKQGVAIVDTGATHSVASPLLYGLLVDNGVCFQETERVIGLADGSRHTKLVRTASVTVTLGGREVETEFWVFPGDDARTLLGRDFIVNAGIVLDIAQETWHFADSPGEKFSFEYSYVLNEPVVLDTLTEDCDVSLRPSEGTALSPAIEVSNTQEPLTSPPYRLSPPKSEALEKELHKLVRTDATFPFTLRTDSSAYALGAALLQGEGADERPVEYASRLLTPAERNYSTTEREALAVVWAVSKFRDYIDRADVVVKSDHQSLRWLMSMMTPQAAGGQGGRIQAPVRGRRKRGRPRRN